MSGLKYDQPSGGIHDFANDGHYSQSVDLGNGLVKVSGQGGWTIKGGPLGGIPSSTEEQVENCFKNLEHALKSAGLRGLSDVYLVRSYHIDLDESMGLVTKATKRLIPSHMPVWTALGTTRLGHPDMKIEIEVEAKRA